MYEFSVALISALAVEKTNNKKQQKQTNKQKQKTPI